MLCRVTRLLMPSASVASAQKWVCKQPRFLALHTFTKFASMGEIRTPAKVKIVVGILAKDADSVNAVRSVLKERFGEEDLNLEPFPFTFTNYYKEEIGDTPVRAFFSYEQLVERESIVDIKLWTNDIEL